MGRHKKPEEEKKSPKRQKITYSQEAEKFIRDNYGEIGFYNMQQGLKKITGKLISYNAIRIKAYRMGLETMQDARIYILIKDLNEALGTTQGNRYVKAGKLGRKEKGINGKVVNVEKFWKWAEHANIDLTGYQRGTLLPEPKADKSGRSWLDRKIAKQVTEKHSKQEWDQLQITKLKTLIEDETITRQQIADRLGFSVNQVDYMIRKLKIVRYIRISVSDKEKEEVRKLYEEGATITELMQMYSRCRKTIKNIIK